MKPEKSLACCAITPDLARRHTAGRIARVARIDYCALKGRLDGSVAPRAAKQERQPVFLEVPVSVGDPKRNAS